MADFTFEQVEKPLYAAAWAMHRKFPMYEVHELVNEAWLQGDIQRVEDIKFVKRRAYFDMVQYLRGQLGRNFMRSKDSTGNFREKTNKHDLFCPDWYDGDRRYDFFESHLIDDGLSYFDCVDNKEAADLVLSRLGKLNKRFVDILRMYYYDGMTMREIGDELDRKECTISVTISRALEVIKEEGLLVSDLRITDAHKAKGKQRKRQNTFWKPPEEEEELVDVLPEYVSDFEIENDSAFEDAIESLEFCLDCEE